MQLSHETGIIHQLPRELLTSESSASHQGIPDDKKSSSAAETPAVQEIDFLAST